MSDHDNGSRRQDSGPPDAYLPQKQVGRDHYLAGYDDASRWSSYWTQINEVLGTKPNNDSKILVVGIGNGVVNRYLHELGLNVVTLDIDAQLAPDILGSVTSLPFTAKAFEVTLCCEVLEHIPFSTVDTALSELSRVTSNRCLISVPHFGPVISLSVKIPKVPAFRATMKLLFPMRLEFDGQHYWEIGRRGYPHSLVTASMSKHFVVLNQWLNPNHTYHRFFRLNPIIETRRSQQKDLRSKSRS